jgi:hypothetical protein
MSQGRTGMRSPPWLSDHEKLFKLFFRNPLSPSCVVVVFLKLSYALHKSADIGCINVFFAPVILPERFNFFGAAMERLLNDRRSYCGDLLARLLIYYCP